MIFWPHKAKDPPEEIKSNKKLDEYSKSTNSQTVNANLENNVSLTDIKFSNERQRYGSVLQINDQNKYVRSKYVRVRSKTSQNDMSFSENSAEVSIHENSK